MEGTRISLLPNREDQLSEIEFYSDNSKPWVMKITKGPKIIFNRKDYPKWKPDNFAQEVMKTIGSQKIFKKALKVLWEAEDKE